MLQCSKSADVSNEMHSEKGEEFNSAPCGVCNKAELKETLSSIEIKENKNVECFEDKGIYINKLCLNNFRNIQTLQLNFDKKPVIFYGQNGVGKTNLLEAISFLIPGKGIRGSKFSDIISNSSNTSGWTVYADMSISGDEYSIGTSFDCEEIKKTEKRQIHINQTQIKNQNDLGVLSSAVYLTPAMDRLFSGDPSGRRRFLDGLCQSFFCDHTSNCAAFAQAQRQWNSLLRNGNFDDAWLSGLEHTMAKYGLKMTKARRKIVENLSNSLLNETSGFPSMTLNLVGGLEKEIKNKDDSEALEFIANYLKQNRNLCAENGSVSGVQSVDLDAFNCQKNRKASGCSTGEQKAMLISVLLAQVETLLKLKNKLPLILFDEASAHLDSNRTDALLEVLEQFKTHIFLTGTSSESYKFWNDKAQFVSVYEISRNQLQVA